LSQINHVFTSVYSRDTTTFDPVGDYLGNSPIATADIENMFVFNEHSKFIKKKGCDFRLQKGVIKIPLGAPLYMFVH